MTDHDRQWLAQLADLDQLDRRRRLPRIDGPQGATLPTEHGHLLNFSSNDYLGLATHPALTEAALRATREFGTGSGASRLISGSLPPHRALEERLARFKQTPRALAFSSGYAAAVSAITTVTGPRDVIILDKLAHACLIDGARLSGATLRVFPHNHTTKLKSHLEWARNHHPANTKVLVLTESVFGMDGDTAPLAEILELAREAGAMTLLDEAHATGTIGSHGRGLAAHLGLSDHVDIHLGTLSKALGSAGGFLAGSDALIDLCINRARPFIFSTAPPPASAAAAAAAIDLLESPGGQSLIQRLDRNIHAFHQLIAQPPPLIPTPIIPRILGSEKRALDAAATLRQQGVFLPAIRHPTVPKGFARLRISLSASHSRENLRLLADKLASLPA